MIMDLKERIADSIERKLGLKDSGLITPYSLYNTIRRMQIIRNLFKKKPDFKRMVKYKRSYDSFSNQITK